MPETYPARRKLRGRRAFHGVFRTRWFWVAVVLLALIVASLAWLGTRVLQTKDELEAAQARVSELTAQAGELDIDAAMATFEAITDHADRAVELSSDPIWRVGEILPGLGTNLTAVRELSAALKFILSDVASPVLDVASGIDPASLAPKDGAIDLSPFQAAVPALASAEEGMTEAIDMVDAIPAEGAVDQVVSAKGTLANALNQLAPLIKTANSIAPLLAPALGAEARLYLSP
jgi:hypothetical protein